MLGQVPFNTWERRVYHALNQQLPSEWIVVSNVSWTLPENGSHLRDGEADFVVLHRPDFANEAAGGDDDVVLLQLPDHVHVPLTRLLLRTNEEEVKLVGAQRAVAVPAPEGGRD